MPRLPADGEPRHLADAAARHPVGPVTDPGHTVRIGTLSYWAEIGTRGAALRTLQFGTRDLVVPTGPELSVLSYSGRVLAPWPNRLRDGAYTWDGTGFRVPINEAATNTALHGLLAWTEFEVGPVSTPGVVLSAALDHPGYPTTLDVSVSFLLGDRGLDVGVTATNTGTRSAPYGAAFHPYLTCGGAPIERCTLTVPARTVAVADERMLPTGTAPVAGDLDLRVPSPFGDRRIDHAFTDLPGGRWEARLEDPVGGLAVVLSSSERWVQVYSGEEACRAGIAVEPMTCPADAFTSGEEVAVVEPGASFTYGFTIGADDARKVRVEA